MPEILGVTNPVPGQEINQINRNMPNSPDSQIVANVPDPSRVTRPDGRAEQQDASAQNQSPLRYDSNFQTFLQRLRETPELALLLSRLFSGKTGTVVSSGMREGVAVELSEFIEMLKMDQEQFEKFLKEQLQTGSRFNGPLFSLLRGAYRQADASSGGSGMKQDILQFLKSYSDHTSTPHVEENIMRELNQMARAIPKSWGAQLMELVAQLENGINAGDRKGNIALLQNKIMPFLAKYVENTHDMGRARDLVTLLTLNISRYESGTESNMLQDFHQLKNYVGLRDILDKIDDKGLLHLIKNTSFAKGAEGNPFIEKLLQTASKAMGGSMGTEAQSTFRDLIVSFLVNESVYMPINHLIIPLEWNGNMVFSEVWVDPDDNSDREGGSRSDQEQSIRFLFKMDIQSLGFFDMVLLVRGEAVQVQVQCPERVALFSQTMEQQITRILTDHGFKAETVLVRKMEQPLELSAVFPKLFAGKDSVNVKV